MRSSVIAVLSTNHNFDLLVTNVRLVNFFDVADFDFCVFILARLSSLLLILITALFYKLFRRLESYVFVGYGCVRFVPADIGCVHISLVHQV